MVSLLIEAVGLTLGLAPNAWLALAGAALTGCGCSLIFPSLWRGSSEARPGARCAAPRSAAMRPFRTSPIWPDRAVTGLLATSLGYSSVFLAGALCAALGILVTLSHFAARLLSGLKSL